MIIIRADGNSKIGSGHVMRCISLAQELKKLGQDVVFFTADNSMSQTICERGFENVILNSDYEDMGLELDNVLDKLFECRPSLFVVDSYYVTEAYLNKVNGVCNVAYFDDFGEKSWPVDYLINYNVFANDTKYEDLYKNSNATLLLQLEYAPLRDEFSNVPVKNVREKANRVLLLTGGGDHEHVALNFIEKIVKKNHELDFDIVAGGLSNDIERLKLLDKENPSINLHVNISNIHKLMINADVAISASGSTAYELCACGTPMITYTFADNQIKASVALSNNRAAIYAGDLRSDKLFYEKLEKQMQDLLRDYMKRKNMSETAKTLCDGKGAERLARALIE